MVVENQPISVHPTDKRGGGGPKKQKIEQGTKQHDRTTKGWGEIGKCTEQSSRREAKKRNTNALLELCLQEKAGQKSLSKTLRSKPHPAGIKDRFKKYMNRIFMTPSVSNATATTTAWYINV